jgi:hypothetical protein
MRKITLFCAVFYILFCGIAKGETPLTRNGYFNNLADFNLYSRKPDTLEELLKKYHQQSGNEVVIVTGTLPFGITAKDLAEKTYTDWSLGKAVVIAIANLPDSNSTLERFFHYDAYIYVSDGLKKYFKEKEGTKLAKKIIVPWLNGREPFLAFFNAAHEAIRLISRREGKPFDFTQVWGLTKSDFENVEPLSKGFMDILVNILEWAAAIIVLLIIAATTKRKSLFRKK